ncbi:hypothetical protein ACIBBD_17875 [Streptomyces sp. NPDC051315]|uniref:hypothetical protein n=1 Tax=Streptomyces sp. NPDC051315 TaxID=3365650 RepID=UPI003793C568
MAKSANQMMTGVNHDLVDRVNELTEENPRLSTAERQATTHPERGTPAAAAATPSSARSTGAAPAREPQADDERRAALTFAGQLRTSLTRTVL